ncbi:MAG: hypothetical protein ACI9BD_001157 [Candidatus Marinamargulisbacteria bacterium]|jgi:hypothetical protein
MRLVSVPLARALMANKTPPLLLEARRQFQKSSGNGAAIVGQPKVQSVMTELMASGLRHVVKMSRQSRNILVYRDARETQFVGKEGCGPASFINGTVLSLLLPHAQVKIRCTSFKDPQSTQWVAHGCNTLEFENQQGIKSTFFVDGTWRQFAVESQAGLGADSLGSLFDEPTLLCQPQEQWVASLAHIYAPIVGSAVFSQSIARNWTDIHEPGSLENTNQLNVFISAIKEKDSVRAGAFMGQLQAPFIRHLYLFFKLPEVQCQLESLGSVSLPGR